MPHLPICICSKITTSPSSSSIEETQTDLFKAIWQIWQTEVNVGGDEQRHIAVKRMQACLEDNCGGLDLSSLNLTTLPSLPPNILVLNCAHNNLTALPSLPLTLREMNCAKNKITHLPPLPGQLIKLHCHQNQLTFLPLLPDSLSNINCSNNRLTELSALSLGLIYLRCHENALVELPPLKHLKLLKAIICHHNSLKNIPQLPKNMYQMTCCDNQLAELPVMPKYFQYLLCNNNQLKQLPSLSRTLLTLECSSNYIEELPKLPKNITKIICSNNRLTQIPTLPPQVIEFSFEGNPLDLRLERLYCQRPILKKTLAHWGINDTHQWEMCINENYADSFIHFLHKLSKAGCSNSSLRKLITAWLTKLALPENQALREETFDIAYQAGTSCHDRVYLSLNFMLLADLAFETKKSIDNGLYDTTSNLQELVDIGQQIYRLDVLMTIGNEKMTAMAQQNKKYDDVDIHLSFQYWLRYPLNLPDFISNMAYRCTEFVTKAELRYALNEVRSREKTEFLPFLATQWEPWKDYLKRCHPAEYDKANEELMDDFLNQSLLEQKITQYLQLKNFPEDDESARCRAAKEVTTKMTLEAMLPLTRFIIDNLKKQPE